MDHLQTKGVIMCIWVCWMLVVVTESADFGDKDDADWLEGAENMDLNVEIHNDEIESAPEISQPVKQATTLRCHRRMYKKSVEQTDAEGRRCWDVLSLEACWGRCDSHEISEWKFPYKISKHPVCGFGARTNGVARLQHCEEGASPEARIYRYVRPETCRCRACSSTDTSCRWLPLSMH